MDINIVERQGALILTVVGELDIATAPRLDEQLTRAQASGAQSVVVDLNRVSFMDSAGLHLLMRHAAASNHDGWRLHLTRGSAQIRRVFEVTGQSDRLPFLAE